MIPFLRGLLVVLTLLVSIPAVIAQDAKLSALMNAAKSNPNDADIRFSLGVEYFNRGTYDLALVEFEKASKLNSKDNQAKEMYQVTKGVLAYNLNDYSGATKGFKSALSLNPKSPVAAKFLGASYLQLKEYGEAEKAFKNYMDAFPTDKEAQSLGGLSLGKIYIQQKRFPEAVAVFQKVLAVDKANYDVYNNLAVAYFQTGNYADAAINWEKASNIKKDDPRVFKYLGYSYYRSGKFSDAIKCYQRSIKLDDKDFDVYYNLAVANLDNGFFDEAADAFDKAVALNPNDGTAALGKAQAIDAAINAHMEKGSANLLNNDYAGALKEWELVLKYQPDHKEAQSLIQDAKGKLGGEVERLYQAGRVAAKKGNTGEALRNWNIALDMEPGNQKVADAIKRLKVNQSAKAGSLVAQGDEYLSAKDYGNAISKYRAALQVNPTSASLKAKLKKAQTDQKADFSKSLANARKFEDAGKLAKAIKAYESARRVDPNNAEAERGLLILRGQVRDQISKLLEQGEGLMASGKKDEARQKFQAVVELDSGNDKANGYIQQLTGSQSQAKVNAEEVKKAYYEGVNLYINGKIEDAIRKWDVCLKMDPDNENAKNNRRKAMLKLESIQKLSQN